MTTKMTIDELRQTPVFRWIDELSEAFQKAGIPGEPVELATKAVFEMPLPDYMPTAAALKSKFMFLMGVYRGGGHWGSMEDALPGLMNMVYLAMEDRK